MHGEAQFTPLVPSSEQCHAPNLTMLVVSTCSNVSQGGEVLWGFRGFVPFVFMCARYVPIHRCLGVCGLDPIHHCFCVCRFQEPRSMKFNVQWGSTCTIYFFKWAKSCPWPSFVGVSYLLVCFSWSVCEALTILCLFHLWSKAWCFVCA